MSPKKTTCPHLAGNRKVPAIIRVDMQVIPDAPTVSDLNTTTELCAICAGFMMTAIIEIERGVYRE